MVNSFGKVVFFFGIPQHNYTIFQQKRYNMRYMSERISPVPVEVTLLHREDDGVIQVDNQSSATTLSPSGVLEAHRRPFVEGLDRYFRNSDTVFARLANLICPYTGERYLNSQYKKLLDLAVSIPAAIVATPVITTLGFAKKVEDGGSIFFVQERLSNAPGETIDLIKIRCMKPHSDAGSGNLQIAQGLKPSEDPRNTKLGSFMRKYQLEELPQLFQVVLGKLSVIGLRPNTKYGFDNLQSTWGQDRFEKWRDAYQSGRLGLSGVNQVFGSPLKEDDKRYHTDVFYTKHASLGLDLYLLWKTATRLLVETKTRQ